MAKKTKSDFDNFVQEYFIQTRKEIDTVKRARDQILYFVVLLLAGCIGLAKLLGKDAATEFSSNCLIPLSALIVTSSLFWIRYRKQRQITNRWFVLYHIAKKYLESFAEDSLESVVCRDLKEQYYYYNAILAQEFQAASRYFLSEHLILKGDTIWTPNKLSG